MDKVITTAPKEALLSRDFLHALATAVIGLDLSRRKTPDWLADVIYNFDGKIVDADGHELIVHDELIDDAHGKDASFAWVSEIRAFASKPPQRRPRASILTRLQLYDAAFKIAGRPIVISSADLD